MTIWLQQTVMWMITTAVTTAVDAAALDLDHPSARLPETAMAAAAMASATTAAAGLSCFCSAAETAIISLAAAMAAATDAAADEAVGGNLYRLFTLPGTSFFRFSRSVCCPISFFFSCSRFLSAAAPQRSLLLSFHIVLINFVKRIFIYNNLMCTSPAVFSSILTIFHLDTWCLSWGGFWF